MFVNDAVDLAVDGRRRVLTGEQRRIEDGRDARRERRQIRAHVRGRVHAHRQELAVRVERELGVRDVVASVGVGQERLAPLRGPLDRAIHPLARPHHRRLFRIEEDLRAEAAADVGRDHAHLVLRQTEHERRHEQTLDVRILARDVERVRVVGAVVRRRCRARLDRVWDKTVVDDVELRDMRGRRECGVDSGLVAKGPCVAVVPRCALVNLCRAGRKRVYAVDDRGKRVVVDVDELRGVLRLMRCLGDDESDHIPHETNLALREHRVRRFLHRRAVGARDEPPTRQAVDAREIVAREDRDHAGGRFRTRRVDATNRRVRVRRTEEERVRRVRHDHVIRVLASAGEKATVFLPADRLADQRCAHDGSVSGSWRRRPAARPRRYSDSRCTGRNSLPVPRGWSSSFAFG